MNTLTLHHRHGLGQFLNDLGLVGDGAEIGVAYGGFSKIVTEQWAGRYLSLIDPWQKQDGAIYKEATNNTAPWESWFEQVKQMCEASSGRLKQYRTTSLIAARYFDDASLDWAYIDGNHDLGPVLEDLRAWTPKVKQGGLIALHDYYDSTGDGGYCFVKSAVDQWCDRHSIKPVQTAGGCTTVYWLKP